MGVILAQNSEYEIITMRSSIWRRSQVSTIVPLDTPTTELVLTRIVSANLISAGALGGRKGRDRASIEVSVAVATLFYRTSGSVCAHACVLCVSSCVCCACARLTTESKN